MPGDPDGRLTAAPHLCRHCGNSGLLYVLREYSEEEDASGGDTAWRTWELVRCPPYGGISLLFSQGTEHEVQGILEEGGSPELILTDTVYPPGELHPKGLPEEVASALEAAERVKPIDFNGYAVLLGRVIERVCADRDARGDNLFEKLKNLEEKGEIPPKLVRVASQFRRMRNIGAHADLGELSAGEADLLSDLCRALLESIYTVPYLAKLAENRAASVRRSRKRRVDARAVIRHVARLYGLKVDEVLSRTNSQQVAFPRQVAMYCCKKLTNLSYPEIGKAFGNKHHSTVMYAVDKIEQLRQTDQDLDRTVRKILRQFD